MAAHDARTQVVLVLPAAKGSGAELPNQAKAAAKVLPVATVIIAPVSPAPIAAPELAPAVQAIQSLGIATLISADAALARIVKADGVHLPASKSVAAAYREARDILGTRFIAGVDVGRTRHDAMTLGEEGADYIGFGIPPHVEDRETARHRRCELIAWWSEIFEVPCIAFDVETPADAQDLAAAGADFIAVGWPDGLPADRGTEFLAPFAAALALPASVS